MFFLMIMIIMMIAGISFLGFVVSYANNAYGISYDENVIGDVTWENASFMIKNGTGFAKIIVTDPDMNKFPHAFWTHFAPL